MSNTQKTYDYLLVGQGLAGSVLALTLWQYGKRLLVVDANAAQSSSKIAAGIFNPITGRKMVKTWLADSLFPFLHRFYPTMEKQLNTRFFHPMPMYFPFASQEKQNDWLLLAGDARYTPFRLQFHETGLYPEHIPTLYGGMEISLSGYLDIPLFLQSTRAFLQEHAALVGTETSSEEFTIHAQGITWRNCRAKRLLLCDGLGGLTPYFFPWLDFRPVKGEVLTVHIESPQFHHIINRNGWILPQYQAPQRYKFGATYHNQYTNSNPSETGKQQLTERLENLTTLPYEIVDHKAGIRPATYDRRPFVGVHPKYPSIGVFNGMGAKGVSLSPFLAQHFVAHLEQGTPLLPEIDVIRCYERAKKRGEL